MVKELFLSFGSMALVLFDSRFGHTQTPYRKAFGYCGNAKALSRGPLNVANPSTLPPPNPNMNLMEVLRMNSAELEISEAVRQVQRGPTVIRYLCLMCKGYLSSWDVRKREAVCWKCRAIYFPPPRIELKSPEPQKATLLQLKDGKFAIIVD